MELTINKLDVSLSLKKFLTGEGPLKELDLTGIKGFLDRRTTIWTEEMEANHKKRTAGWGDFHLENLKLKDLAITIHQNNPSRPLELTIFSIKIPRIRQHWLLFDIFNAESGHGEFDGSLFFVENMLTEEEEQKRYVSLN